MEDNNKRIWVILFCLFCVNSLFAKTWQTVGNGFWSSNTVWLGGVAPSFVSSDTFLIKTPILLDSSLTLSSGAFLKIDSTGGVCGHQSITVNSGAEILKYGILELDVLNVPGGTVNCFAPGVVILTQYGVLSNGGSLSINSSLSVGPWFDCVIPEYSYAVGIEESSQISFSVYPNPFSNTTTFSLNSLLNGAKILIYNSYGKLVREIRDISEQEIILQRGSLPSGIYFCQLIEDGKIILNEKLVIIDN